MKLNDNIKTLNGIGPKKAAIFSEMGIETLEDLAYYFPGTYEDRRTVTKICDLTAGDDCLIEAKIVSKRVSGNRYSKKAPLVLNINDGSGIAEVIFFNGKFLDKLFDIGKIYVFYGRVSENFDRKQLSHPQFALAGSDDDIRDVIPVYSLKQGISQKEMRRLQKEIRNIYSEIKEWLPEDVVSKNRLASPGFAISNMHFPSDGKKVLQSKYRMIFEELIVLETGLLYIRNGFASEEGIRIDSAMGETFISRLEFELTEGQIEAWNEIKSDLKNNKKMNRLLQGDVGSGKTVIAEASMISAAFSGYQSVIMAPTELLARQHFETFHKDFNKYGIEPRLLISSMSAADKRNTVADISSGEAKVIIATHSVLEENVIFQNLALVITDEQHRFGVNQRKLLSNKGKGVNVLVMTATPIPRTIAVILYGDLDISQIKTLPKGRKRIHTYKCKDKDRSKVLEFLRKEVASGRQAYVVAPLIEESDNLDAKSAKEIYEELSLRFDDFHVSLVHGGMKSAEKDEIMRKFADGEIDILVSTVVIEVGINVPNASVMLIESAERFGLAQLHQLRGRVGRGKDEAYCFLMLYNNSEVSNARAEILTRSMSGFEIAEEDLKLRGPGEIFGTKQHGLPELKLSDLLRHKDVLEAALKSAKQIVKDDSALVKPQNALLKNRIKKMFGESISIEL